MSLTIRFREAAIAQSLGKNTVATYAHWHTRGFSPLDVGRAAITL